MCKCASQHRTGGKRQTSNVNAKNVLRHLDIDIENHQGYCNQKLKLKTLLKWGCLLNPLKSTQRHRAIYALTGLNAGRLFKISLPEPSTGGAKNKFLQLKTKFL